MTHEVTTEDPDLWSSDDDFFIGALFADSLQTESSAWYVIAEIEGSKVKFKVDTGAAVTILPSKGCVKGA